MKALGNKTIHRRAEKEVAKEVAKIYDELYYEAFRESAPDVMRQTLAVVLFAMSLHAMAKYVWSRSLDGQKPY